MDENPRENDYTTRELVSAAVNKYNRMAEGGGIADTMEKVENADGDHIQGTRKEPVGGHGEKRYDMGARQQQRRWQ